MINILNMDYRIHDEWCKEFYSQYISERDKVCVLAFSFRESQISSSDEWLSYYGTEEGIYYRGIVESYVSFGISEECITFVNYFSHTKEDIIKIINDSTILYLPGGIPTSFYDKLVKKELLNIISDYEGVIIGCSAGAMIQMDEYFISPDKDYPDFAIEQGIGLLFGFGVEAHFDGSNAQLESIEKYMKITNNPVYAIGDDGILIVDGTGIKLYGDVATFKNED